MILIAEMKNGETFEATSKKKLTAAMIEHFVENNCEVGKIKAIYCVFKNDETNEFCNDVVMRIQNIVDEGVSKWRKQADIEYQGQKQIESEIRGGIYG